MFMCRNKKPGVSRERPILVNLKTQLPLYFIAEIKQVVAAGYQTQTLTDSSVQKNTHLLIAF